jgi:neutral ceramidase
MEFLTGLGRHDITCFLPGVGMMGYGQVHNTVKETATPLWARALVVQNNEKSLFILIHLELAFVSMAIKEEILTLIETHHPEWRIGHGNLLVTAQHTHAAPGGYSHYPFYNFTIPGFQLQIFKTITSGAFKALEQAYNDLEPSTIMLGEVEISTDKEVAFNRSLKAHLNNPEANKENGKESAVDRRMRGLIINSKEGKLRAMINWFGVHCTSVSSYNHRIHHDNKGVAASLFEKNHPGTFAFYLQSAAGDVSPNFIWDKKIKRMRGKFADQYESTDYNGELQFREGQRIKGRQQVRGNVQGLHCFFDMRDVAKAPAHGVAFFKGTLEGPGIPSRIGPFICALSRLVRAIKIHTNPQMHRDFYAEQFPKDVVLDHRDGSFLGIPLCLIKKLPPLPDPILEKFRQTASNNALETLPWVPAIIPFQLICLGQVLLVAIPGEITTMAARRLEEHLKLQTSSLNFTEIIITSYANGYMGYITTPEEYDLQSYEAGHTIYGRKSLQGIFQAIDQLVAELKGGVSAAEVSAFHFPAEELAKRSF